MARAGFLSAALAALLAAASARAAPLPSPQDQALARDMLGQLVGIDSTAANGTMAAAQAIAARFRGAGFPPGDVQVLAPADAPSRANVVVRLRGSGRARPLLMIGHIDVVEAARAHWTVDPFKLTEKDGFFYGRGSLDMKDEDVAVMDALIRMHREGFTPDRDIVAAFTADEEAGEHNGVQWLLAAHPELMDAALAVNPDEGAAGLRGGRRVYYGVQTSTKRYVTFVLRTTGHTGHTAIPYPDNAIYKLSAALTRLGGFQFPIELDATTRAYFARTAAGESGQTRADMAAVGASGDVSAAERLSANPERNASLRTTCVATLLRAGTAENALADTAEATVQCRLLPADSPAQVRRTLEAVLADPRVAVTMTEAGEPNPASPPSPLLMARIEAAAHSMWPGLLVLPSLNIGASDSVYTRAAGVPTYGLCSVFYDLDDDRAHGDDERIGVTSFYEGVEFTYRLFKALSAA